MHAFALNTHIHGEMCIYVSSVRAVPANMIGCPVS